MKRVIKKRERRIKRKMHIRKRILGTPERPRMSVFRSNKNMYIQVIDDSEGKTLAFVSTMEKANRDFRVTVVDGEKLGMILGERLKEKNIKQVVFDRNGYLYHGVVKAVADGARKAGIEF